MPGPFRARRSALPGGEASQRYAKHDLRPPLRLGLQVERSPQLLGAISEALEPLARPDVQRVEPAAVVANQDPKPSSSRADLHLDSGRIRMAGYVRDYLFEEEQCVTPHVRGNFPAKLVVSGRPELHAAPVVFKHRERRLDRKSTRLNSSHRCIS